jgi:RNA polymerase sigma-70 factor (ECF subfamily)
VWADVDHAEVRDPRAYLVRIVTRQALNRLRTLARRRSEYIGEWLPEPLLTRPDVVLVADGGEVTAFRRPVVGSDRVATLLSRFNTVVPGAVVGSAWLNGAPAGRIDLDGEIDSALSLVVADGRITRIYAIRNPHKLARMDEEATLSR